MLPCNEQRIICSNVSAPSALQPCEPTEIDVSIFSTLYRNRREKLDPVCRPKYLCLDSNTYPSAHDSVHATHPRRSQNKRQPDCKRSLKKEALTKVLRCNGHNTVVNVIAFVSAQAPAAFLVADMARILSVALLNFLVFKVFMATCSTDASCGISASRFETKCRQ